MSESLAELKNRIMDGARVSRAVHAGWTQMAVHRQVRAFIFNEFAGPWYSQFFQNMDDRDDNTKRPVSLLKRLIDTYLPNVVGTEIHAKVAPKRAGLSGNAKLREMILDHLAEVTGLARTHRLVVMDAILGGLGIYKVGVRAGTEVVKVAGEQYDIGQPYACRVDMDDFARDPNSRDPDEDSWRSVRYRVSKTFLLESGVFKSDIVENLPTLRGFTPNPGDAELISKGASSVVDTIDDLVELWDVIIYRGDKVLECTLPSLGTSVGGKGFVMEPREYEGPERGPLIEMRLRELPNNAHPISMGGQLLDLHLGESALATKIMRRMLSRCRKVFAKKEEENEALELGNNLDDEIIPGEWNGKQADLGGIDEGDLAALKQVTEWGNNETANLQQSGGNTDPTIKTATVGSILQGNAQVKLGDLRAVTTGPLKQVMRCFAWYVDQDPFFQKQFSMRVPGGDMIDVQYDQRSKKGNFADFDYDTQAISEEPTDPRQKRAEFAQFMQFSAAWLAAVQQTGGNLEAAVRILSDRYDEPELDEVYPTQGGAQVAMAQQQQAMVPGQGGAVGARPAGPKAPSLPKPGQVRSRIDQRQADVAGAVNAV